MTVQVVVERKRLLRSLLAVALVLALASALVQIPRYYLDEDLYTLVDLFDAAGEGNVPTWFNALVLLACGVVAGVLAAAAVKRRDVWSKHWIAAALVLAFAATDEASEIHEIGNLLRSVTGNDGLLRHPWVILGALAVIALTAYFLRFVRALPGRTRRIVVLAGAMYVGAALGLELIENALSSAADGRETMGRSLLETAEELLETSAAILLLDALLGYAQDRCVTVHARVAAEKGANSAGRC